MKATEITLAKMAARQHGALSRQQLLAAGVSTDQIRERTESGLLVPVYAGAYRHAAIPPTWRSRLAAAVLAAGDGAVASHRSAGRLHGLRDVPRFRPEVTVPRLSHPVRSGIAVHRSNRMELLDRTVVDGILATTVARTLLDLGAILPFEMVTTAAQDALIRRLANEIDLVAVLERLGGHGRRGTAVLRVVVLQSLPPEEIESWLEQELHQLVRSLPVEAPVLQYELTCDDGREVRLDQAWPDSRIAVDADGRLWHAIKKDFEQTMARSRSIVASGWSHYRYGWTDVRYLRAHTRAELLAILPPAPR